MIKANLKPGQHVHLVGICGTAMASLAGLLQEKGFQVSGSDSNPYPPMSLLLERLKIPVKTPYSAKNLSPKPDFVIIGNVIPASNEEAKEVARLEIPFTSLPMALGELIIDGKQSIVITGTHGKTTTTSLMAWTAQELGLDPGYLIGGIAKNFGRSFEVGEGNFFIIEGDEYDTAYFDKVPKFLHYRPKHVVITSIEFDHADIYADLAAIETQFKKLVQLIPEDGTLVYWADSELVSKIAQPCKGRKIGYGIKSGDIRCKILSTDPQGTRFSLSDGTGKILADFSVPMAGEYNVLNASAVCAMALSLGWSLERVKSAFLSFQGIKRRQEVLGEPGGVLVIEDFAHHPTAVKETLQGMRSRYPGKKLFAVFEPRSATSRRKVFQKDYLNAFLLADEVLIAKPFDQSKINEQDRFSSEDLVSELQSHDKHAFVYEGVDPIVSDLKLKCRPGDLVIIMSNGGFDGIYQKVLDALAHQKVSGA